MRIPNVEGAYVPRSKLLDYLLSTSHPVGSAKAGFFRGVGFDESTVERLEHGLAGIAASEDVTTVVPSVHGVKYVVDGMLGTPRGARVPIRTVWIVENGEDRPRFVTAYPNRTESEGT
jgi:hypothetical protein